MEVSIHHQTSPNL